MRHLVDQLEDNLAAFAQHGQRKTKEDGKEQNLQDITLGKGIHHTVGDDVHGKVDHVVGLGLGGEGREGLGIQLGDIGIHADPRLNDTYHQKANRQGQ